MEGYEYLQKGKQGQFIPQIDSAEEENLGIIPRMINDVFAQKQKKSKGRHISIYCSFLQIYNERVFDLLNESQSYKDGGLRVRWTKQDQF